jgi:hypothetical protein
LATPLPALRADLPLKGGGEPSLPRDLLRTLILCAATTLLSTPACAHGFGQRYDLPIPLSFYLAGVAAAVVVSFIIVGLFVRAAPRAESYPRLDLFVLPLVRVLAPATALALKLLALAVFIVTVMAALRGDPNPYRNIAPSMVWIAGWVGLAYVSAFVGNVWAAINPWRTIFETLETLHGGITGRPALSLRLPYPAALGVWPAFVLLLAFSWIELVYSNPAEPAFLGRLLVTYSILTFAGMFLFGGETWLARGELFTLVFGTFARFAPLDVRTGAQRGLWLRPYGAGLLDTGAVSTSMMAFVLLLLATVLYDGALGTPEWGRLESTLAPSLAALGDFKFMAIRTFGLLAFWLVFFGAYVGVSGVMRAVTPSPLPTLAIARAFAFTLVPIAIGYHLAHYLTFLLIQGQYLIPLASDPFGFGWNLFGTAHYRVDIAIVGATFAWYTAVSAILLGHVAAVYLAHRKAIEVIGTRAGALRSQVPLTALMVAYTFVSLTILAEPITERRTPAQPTQVAGEMIVPDDAVVPEPGSGRLLPVGPGKVARQKLTYRLLGSAFHDGTRLNAADLLYATMFAYRWGARSDREDAPFDPLVAAATATMRAELVGLRVLGADSTSKTIRFGDFEYVRELHVVDVYVSRVALDREQDAAFAPPWTTLPWHLIVLMEQAVSRGLAAFSESEAKRRGVPWLDIVRSPELNTQLAALAETFAREGYRPEALKPLVGADEARKRWTALLAFFKERGHFLVANGPYLVKGWSADGVTLQAFRDLSYPLGVGSYDAYAVPRRGFLTGIEQQGDRIKLFGDIELAMKHMRSYDIVRKPLQSIAADVRLRAAPECRYLVTDQDGRVLIAGTAALEGDATFSLDLGGKLPAGEFTLAAQIVVNGNAANVEIRRFPISISAR